MHGMELAVYIFFGACVLWIAWGFLQMFVFHRPARWDPPARRPATGTRHGAAGAADSPDSTPGINSASAERADFAGGTTTELTADAGDSDSGGSDSGGGFESGGGESGGGGSSGSWS